MSNAPLVRSLALAALLAACGDPQPIDQQRIDAAAIDGAPRDGNANDSGPIDSGAIDSSATDASAIDASAIDSGAIDASAIDGGAIDAGAIDSGATDAGAVDAATLDAPPVDAGPIDAAPPIDTPPASGCTPLDLTAAQACSIALTGTVTACSIDAAGHPSQRGYLTVRRPDGALGYLCASTWTDSGGYYFGSRLHLVTSSAGCCAGTTGTQLAWPAVDAQLGPPHGPTHVKPQEMVTDTGGLIRHNPFAIVVSSPSAAAAVAQARAQWLAWSGDGQPHPAPDGSGAYYFPAFTPVDYVVVPTSGGAPLIVIAPEATLDPAYQRPLGHPTLGACSAGGGAPMAFLGGDVQGTTLTNGSGRFGYESTVTAAHLEAAAALFNCYGIPIHDTLYSEF